jgi:hypothetical protein
VEQSLPAMLSCFGKLLRARELFGQIMESAASFREGEHYEIVRWDNASYATDPLVRVQWRYRVLNPTPEDWAYLTGDAVNNMRSALDHALAEVARSVQGMTDEQVQKSRLQFPICDTADVFNKAVKALRKLLSQEVIDTLEQLQPYHGEPDRYEHDLAMLRDLSNLDKHRQLTIVTHAVFGAKVTIEPAMEIVELHENTGALRDGAVLATVKFRRPVDPPELTLTPEIRHAEAVSVPWLEQFLPLAVVLELLFEETFFAVEALTRGLMGPKEIMFAQIYLGDREKRMDALMRTIATAEEIEKFIRDESDSQ